MDMRDTHSIIDGGPRERHKGSCRAVERLARDKGETKGSMVKRCVMYMSHDVGYP